MLPPRSAPVYQCPTGHLICNECQPSLPRCPICNIKYKSLITRDFFVEKLLELIERKCRYETFGCEFSSKVGEELGDHENICDKKPAIVVKRKIKKESNIADNNDADEEAENENEDANDDDAEEEDDDDEEDVIEVEDIFVSNFAFIVVLLRAYVIEFVSSDTDSFYFEYFLLLLLIAWLHNAWQENGLRVLLDETSPFIAGWFATIVLSMMMLKTMYATEKGEEEAFYNQLVTSIKPAITLFTGLFCCITHAYVYDMRDDNLFVLGCVLMISLVLPVVEVMWDLQTQLDQFYYFLFWLQSFFIVLPFGMIGRNFLEF